MVSANGIIPDKILRELAVEDREIGEQEILMVINELLLDGAIEAFTVGVHLRRSWVSMPVGDSYGLEGMVKVLHKLTPVIRECCPDWRRVARLGCSKEGSGRSGSVR